MGGAHWTVVVTEPVPPLRCTEKSATRRLDTGRRRDPGRPTPRTGEALRRHRRPSKCARRDTSHGARDDVRPNLGRDGDRQPRAGARDDSVAADRPRSTRCLPRHPSPPNADSFRLDGAVRARASRTVGVHDVRLGIRPSCVRAVWARPRSSVTPARASRRRRRTTSRRSARSRCASRGSRCPRR